LLHGLYWLCANLSDEGPLLLTVDHAELADVPSLRFLCHLVQRLADLPLAVVLGTSSPCPAPQLTLLEEIAKEPTTMASSCHRSRPPRSPRQFGTGSTRTPMTSSAGRASRPRPEIRSSSESWPMSSRPAA
jgi:hypothetical protein